MTGFVQVSTSASFSAGTLDVAGEGRPTAQRVSAEVEVGVESITISSG